MPPKKRSPRARTPHRASLVYLVLRSGWHLFRRGSPLWLTVGLVGLGVFASQRYVAHASAFTVQRVQEPALPGWRRTIPVEGRSLLHVDIRALAAQLAQANPQMKHLRVTRQWPATLRIEGVARRPVAQLRLREFFPVDEEGFVFATGTGAPAPALPIVDGVEQRGQRLVPGTIVATSRLQLALHVLELLRAAPSLEGEVVTLLNAADPQQLIFRLQRGIEVRVGAADELPRALERLGPVLAKLEANELTPQYIDLRFGDPVIGPR